jgi:nucleoside-diphosphate-sugar epimerase
MLEFIRKGLFPIVGSGRDYWSLIHVDDASDAVLEAVQDHTRAAGKVFNVCDDEPVMYGDMARFIAKSLDARMPNRIPRFLGGLMLGSHVVEASFVSMRVRNERIKEELGWKPRFPTYREGYAEVIERWRRSQS